ncbi:Ileal sodium/bile acid cotransporter like protein [Argiope bruennichi]|uniref:Ileal sodium/bile acid cotransporter like protein n=1 Tax=Argiope bruennichi TaxID=94029 RepID=A0A8T0DZ02_ARGBR|nr:Ileal sodium/bile acid cotransporter like protein [Argiope bruennichi]
MDNETIHINLTSETFDRNGLCLSFDIKLSPNFSSVNSTLIYDSWSKNIKPILDYLMIVILVVIMLAMGCEITWRSLWKHVKRPIGLCIGIISQFVIVPLSGYLILTATGITGLHATGVLIISCCPGGVLSNTFTYFFEGDLSLSFHKRCHDLFLYDNGSMHDAGKYLALREILQFREFDDSVSKNGSFPHQRHFTCGRWNDPEMEISTNSNTNHKTGKLLRNPHHVRVHHHRSGCIPKHVHRHPSEAVRRHPVSASHRSEPGFQPGHSAEAEDPSEEDDCYRMWCAERADIAHNNLHVIFFGRSGRDSLTSLAVWICNDDCMLHHMRHFPALQKTFDFQFSKGQVGVCNEGWYVLLHIDIQDIRSSEEVDLMHWNTVGNYIGQMIVIAYHLLQASVFRHMFFSVPGKVSGVIITLPVLSSFLGCILAYSFKKTVSVSKVIAIVCELQNVKRILVIISRSFDVETQRNAILLPWLYRFLLQRIKKE